jgi:hypothetical protein
MATPASSSAVPSAGRTTGRVDAIAAISGGTTIAPAASMIAV